MKTLKELHQEYQNAYLEMGEANIVKRMAMSRIYMAIEQIDEKARIAEYAFTQASIAYFKALGVK